MAAGTSPRTSSRSANSRWMSGQPGRSFSASMSRFLAESSLATSSALSFAACGGRPSLAAAGCDRPTATSNSSFDAAVARLLALSGPQRRLISSAARLALAMSRCSHASSKRAKCVWRSSGLAVRIACHSRSAATWSPRLRRIAATADNSRPDCSTGSDAAFASTPCRMSLASSTGARAASRARSTSICGVSAIDAGILSHCFMAAARPSCRMVAMTTRSQSCGSSPWASIAFAKTAAAAAESPAMTR